jgi:hypothetical protein
MNPVKTLRYERLQSREGELWSGGARGFVEVCMPNADRKCPDAVTSPCTARTCAPEPQHHTSLHYWSFTMRRVVCQSFRYD